MARFQPGALVSGVSGVVGGVEFAAGKSGGVVKSRRRNRGVNTARWTAASCTLQWFAGLWATAPEALRSAWVSYAAAMSITNRWGKSMQATGYQASLMWHSCLYDALDRVTGGGSVMLGPPVSTLHPGYIWTATASFTVGGPYTLTNVITHGVWCFEVLYASRSQRKKLTGATNRRFIGSLHKFADSIDWYAKFTAPGCDWELQEGEWVLLEWYHMEYSFSMGTFGWPNRTARWLTQVQAP